MRYRSMYLCSRWTMLIFNFVFFILSVVYVAMSAQFLNRASVARNIDLKSLGLKDNTDADVRIAYTILVPSALTIFISIFGCFGAITEHFKCIKIYRPIMALVLIAMFISAVFVGIKKDDDAETVADQLTKAQNNFIGIPKSVEKPSLSYDIFMITWKCCGVSGPQDFSKKVSSNDKQKWFNIGRRNGSINLAIPYSCCKLKNTSFINDEKYAQIKDYLVDKKCGPKMVESYTSGCLYEYLYDLGEIRATQITYVVLCITTGIILKICSQMMFKYMDAQHLLEPQSDSESGSPTHSGSDGSAKQQNQQSSDDSS